MWSHNGESSKFKVIWIFLDFLEFEQICNIKNVISGLTVNTAVKQIAFSSFSFHTTVTIGSFGGSCSAGLC